MFQRKSKPEQVQKSASAAKDKAVAGAGSVLTAVKEAFDGKVAPKASAAAEAASARAAEAAEVAKEKSSDLRHQARDKASHARDRAVSGLDHGIDSAVPKGQEAVASIAPKVDHARDVIVDEVLPKLSELLGNLQQSKDELLSRQNGPIATVTGAPKKQKRKGGALIVFGVAAAIGAAVAYYLNSQKKPATDPWATEHHVGGAPGVDTQVRASLADRGTATSGGATASGAAAGGTGTGGLGGTGAGLGSTGSTSGTASDTPIADSLTREAADRAASAESTDAPSHAGAEATKMLSGEEIDDLAKETPNADSDIPGSSGSHATSGFGTDFGEVDTAKHNAEEAGDSIEDATDRKTDLP